ncbi:MAG: MFS transporter [Anaerolineae bacterium]|jgi:MFS family permease|nr:MFS transporter [Anaerolineae bacterium]MBT3714742.1 MFS transporter [Anaerolineae bacterium]MBT4310004.1 MFS transporter [Anaerolineae bacterium]MBT4458018.1 MFS transporter [Anaerolineae bacterium]MBT6322208.1 MFS transporter [Anaerolineae bacterium]
MQKQENKENKIASRMRNFYILWIGQFISIFASSMTNFAITLWAWELTGSATSLVLVGVAYALPSAIFSPFAGALIDRWNRKLIIMLSDFSAAFSTFVLLILFATDNIEIWHLYLAAVFSGIFGSFQYPAYASVITMMVPKEQYSRANSLRSVIQSASGIGAPLLAGSLLVVFDISDIMIIDLITFFIALGTLLAIQIPQPKESDEGKEGKGSIWKETLHGFRYIRARESLFAIMLLLMFSNIAAALTFPMMSPMILAKTGSDSIILGTTRSVGSIGFLVGGLVTSIWAGPKKRIHGINISFVLWGLLGAFIFGSAWTMTTWIIGAFFMSIFNPMINSFYIAILQAKVAPDLQGRIFGLENAITTITYPLGQIIAGLAVDHFLEPALMPNGSLADGIFGQLAGTGAGAGMGLTILVGGVFAVLTGVAGYAIKSIREIETLLPDHESAPSLS